MSFFNLLLLLFVIVMYAYLLIVKKEIKISAQRRKSKLLMFLGILVAVSLLSGNYDVNSFIQSGLSLLIILSFFLDSSGLAEDRIVIHSMDKKGIPYQEVDKIYLYPVPDKQEVRVNFFRRGLRGPMLIFRVPIDELLDFFSKHLSEKAEVNIYSGE